MQDWGSVWTVRLLAFNGRASSGESDCSRRAGDRADEVVVAWLANFGGRRGHGFLRLEGHTAGGETLLGPHLRR